MLQLVVVSNFGVFKLGTNLLRLGQAYELRVMNLTAVSFGLVEEVLDVAPHPTVS
jgi:hypothetical protein